MYRQFVQLLQSAGGGMLSTCIFLLGGYILDSFMNPKYANFIALLIGAVVNFIIQTYAFVDKKSFRNHLIQKYLVSEIIIISLTQLGLIYFLDHQKNYKKQLPKEIQPYYITIARIITASTVFLFASFPLRKLWVFI